MSETHRFILAMAIYAFLAPIATSYIWDWFMKQSWYRNTRTVGWVFGILAGPLLWIAWAKRLLVSDWKQYWVLRDAQAAARRACKESEGRFTFVEGKLVKREMVEFRPQLLDTSKPFFWDLVGCLADQARLTIGDHAVESQVTSFLCTRNGIIKRLKIATASPGKEREVQIWNQGLTTLNAQLMGWRQDQGDNGEYSWKQVGVGLGWCRDCHVKIRLCQCPSKLPEVETPPPKTPRSRFID